MIPFLAETANIEPIILIDNDPRAVGLPGGKTPVVIGVFDDGTSMYFDRFTDNPAVYIEAFLMLDRKISKNGPEIPKEFIWITNL
jgi:hypothetical protein